MTSPIALAYEHFLVPSLDRYPMSHAAYLAALAKNRVMVTWFSGSREWAKDVHLLSAIFHTDTGQWEPITDLVSEVGYSVGNSVAERDALGNIHTWYVRTKGYWHDGEIVHMVWRDLKGGFTSKDVLPLAQGWLIRGRPIFRGGVMHLPVYNEKSTVSAVWVQDLSQKEGTLMETMDAEGGLIHPTLVDIGKSEFRCFLRNPRPPNRIHFAYSMDRGATWSRPYPTALPNPNSGIDVARISGERLICAYNDSEKHRYPLSLAVSDNGGRDWEKIGDLEREQGEFSYPTLLFAGNTLYMAYTYKREAIKFIVIDSGAL